MKVMVTVIRKVDFTLIRRLRREPGHDAIGAFGLVAMKLLLGWRLARWRCGVVMGVVLGDAFKEFMDGDVVGRHVVYVGNSELVLLG